jgi:hypothetical protein
MMATGQQPSLYRVTAALGLLAAYHHAVSLRMWLRAEGFLVLECGVIRRGRDDRTKVPVATILGAV